MGRVVLYLLLLVHFVFANCEINSSEINNSTTSVTTDAAIIEKLDKKLATLQKDDTLNNEWTKAYSTFVMRKELLARKVYLQGQIKKLKVVHHLTKTQEEKLDSLQKELTVINNKINLIKNFENDPFKSLIAPPSLSDAPKITNPIAIINGLSYLKELKNRTSSYINKYKILNGTILKLKEEQKLLNNIVLESNNTIAKEHLDEINKEIKHLQTTLDIFDTTKNIYLKKADEIKIDIQRGIKKELEKAVYIGVIVLFFLIIFLFSKYLTRKYFSDKESFYTINKVINITFISILILTLLFAYIENVSYLVTILGFASAGIAIAMKDWFMSLMGWFVIVLGGAVHVGDRIKVVRGNTEYVGDVVDISLLRMTVQEDVTLTTYMHNRRAGRFIFVPNNYIFTDMIANYSHSGLKTVWDGIDFNITFDSNIPKASNIAKNIAKKYAKGYTDITRKQLNKLRSKYQLKNTNVEPRVFVLLEEFGMRVSVWYLTNAYATLTLRTTISTKIIEEIQKSDDIKIAFPTQSIYVDKPIPKPILDSNVPINPDLV